jgi:nucleotide-binding universal stress UspA family protein
MATMLALGERIAITSRPHRLCGEVRMRIGSATDVARVARAYRRVMFRTIVAGTDVSEKGRNAVVLAHELAWATGARLVLVAVHDHGPGQPGDLVGRLRALRNELAPGALALTVADPSPANALLRIAEEQGADLIVVGARERGRLRRVVEGEPGMRVLRSARCAVAVVPDGAAPPRRLARIGVLTGETPEALAALDLADALARRSGGRVTRLERAAEAAWVDLLVLGSRDAGDVRRIVSAVGCPLLVAPRASWEPAIAVTQVNVARV